MTVWRRKVADHFSGRVGWRKSKLIAGRNSFCLATLVVADEGSTDSDVRRVSSSVSVRVLSVAGNLLGMLRGGPNACGVYGVGYRFL